MRLLSQRQKAQEAAWLSYLSISFVSHISFEQCLRWAQVDVTYAVTLHQNWGTPSIGNPIFYIMGYEQWLIILNFLSGSSCSSTPEMISNHCFLPPARILLGHISQKSPPASALGLMFPLTNFPSTDPHHGPWVEIPTCPCYVQSWFALSHCKTPLQWPLPQSQRPPWTKSSLLCVSSVTE